MTRAVKALRAWLQTQTGRVVVRDVAVSAAAGYAVFQASGGKVTAGAASAAGMAALKLLLRRLVPDLWHELAGPSDTAGIVQPTLPAGVHAATTSPMAYTAPRPAAIAARHPDSFVVVIPEFHSPFGGRLGRHINHDPRSRDFRVGPHLGPLVSVQHRRHVGIYEQGELGDCVPHAGKGVVSTAPFTRRFTSERGIIATYIELTATDDIPGYYKPGDPASQDTGSDGLSFAKLAVRHGWCSAYQHAFGIDDALAALQRSAVMTGVNWYESMDTPNGDGLVAIGGAVRGGHEFTVDEYKKRGTVANLDEDLVGFPNSWGLSWGLRGRAYMVARTWAQLLEQNGDVIALIP